ncbi:MAG: hypothetical protein HY428_02920 [Candidatus Levybacteria bacterium]|nr:hypothetical protein [Candidatus Levybacteria bacterium]
MKNSQFKTNQQTISKKIALITSLCALVYTLCRTEAPVAEAFTMSSPNYTIRMGTADPESARKSLKSTNAQVTSETTSRQTSIVKAGFGESLRFTFSINQTVIDFGTLTPTNPVTRTNELSVFQSPITGYSIIAQEDHQLLSGSDISIPDATCDNGSCTDSLASPWSSTLVFGFGYRCKNITGNDCASDFALESNYKQFPDFAKQESPQGVMIGRGGIRDAKARISYRINISGTQAPGPYKNVITYLAVPNF